MSGESGFELRDQIERSAEYLLRLIGVSRKRIRDIESQMIDHLAVVTGDSQKRLTAARRIIAALEKQLDTINNFLRTGSESDLFAAHKMVTRPLILPNDSVNKLISEADIEPIPPKEIQPTLEKLLTSITIQKRQQQNF